MALVHRTQFECIGQPSFDVQAADLSYIRKNKVKVMIKVQQDSLNYSYFEIYADSYLSGLFSPVLKSQNQYCPLLTLLNSKNPNNVIILSPHRITLMQK